ncbi:hypothetical protein [Streptosporangium sp. NPDC023615]|uniref:hypothetical protein n=1 Tax=Streptosporangium sp. NPDC023615 TaxID=3154794 RepID=UPI00342AAD0F
MPGPGSGDEPSTRPSTRPSGRPSGTSLGTPSGRPPGEPSDPPSDPPSDVSFDGRVADFYSPGVPLNRVRPRPRATTVPADLLLRILEPPAVKVRHIPLVDLLRKPYRELGGD